MVIRAKRHDPDLDDKLIRHVKKFKCLGTLYTNSGGSGYEIKHRMRMTKTAIRLLHPFIRSKNLSTQTKKKLQHNRKYHINIRKRDVENYKENAWGKYRLQK